MTASRRAERRVKRAIQWRDPRFWGHPDVHDRIVAQRIADNKAAKKKLRAASRRKGARNG